MIAPPYDVVGEAEVVALQRRSPYNVARVEAPLGEADERYANAAEQLRGWEAQGALRRDAAPAFYVYEQVAAIERSVRTRRGFFARLRLSPFADGLVRPHERTMTGPKADRLRLLEATQTNVSPLLVLYRDAEGVAAALLAEAVAAEPAFEATDGRGDRHRLWVVDDERRIEVLRKAAAASKATMADGHHRYETALNHLAASDEEGRRWVLACLVAEDDPGLVVLPAHRLVQDAKPPPDLLARLEELYAVERLAGDLADLADPSNTAAVTRLWEQVQAGAATPGTFGLVGLDAASLHLLRARSPAALDAAMPREWSAASRSLDVLLLTETILGPLLGIDAEALTSSRVEFSEEAGRAWEWALSGTDRLAFLVNPTRVEQVVAVADEGEVLPQKSTFFYPKLATGMVLNRLD